MTRTMLRALVFLLFLGYFGALTAGVHKDYEGCGGKREQRLEVASQNCLAETIYYEAGNQPEEGKIAVAFVVLNRVKKNNSTVCDVVKQPHQFAWYSNRTLRRKAKNPQQWADCIELAQNILANPNYYDPTSGAIAFRRPVDAHFSKKWVSTVKIGGHIFYAER